MDDIIGSASRELAVALQRIGKKATLSMATASAELVIDKRPVMVAVRGVGNGEPSDAEAFKRGASFRVMIRVDAEACASAGLPGGRDLDRWIGVQEQTLNVLLRDWDGRYCPMDSKEHRLRMVIAPGTENDEWVRHMVTRDRYRLSLWEVCRVGGAR